MTGPSGPLPGFDAQGQFGTGGLPNGWTPPAGQPASLGAPSWQWNGINGYQNAWLGGNSASASAAGGWPTGGSAWTQNRGGIPNFSSAANTFANDPFNLGQTGNSWSNQGGTSWASGGPHKGTNGFNQPGMGFGPFNAGPSPQPQSGGPSASQGPWGPPPGASWMPQIPEDIRILYSLPFPPNWKLPPFGTVPINPRYNDTDKVIERGYIKPFLGTIEDYPRFQQSFYRMVHIQPSAVFYKIENKALDKLITDERSTKLLEGLGTSPPDYVLRIARLEQAYGGPGRLQSQQIRTLRELDGNLDKDLSTFRTYTHALLSYLWNAGPQAIDNPLLLETVKEHMSQALQVQYNQFLALYQCPDNNQTAAHFLQTRLACEDRAREGTKKKPGSKTFIWATPSDTGTSGPGYIPDGPQDWSGPEPAMHQEQVHAQGNSAQPCPCCQQRGHRIAVCEKFYLMGPMDRRAMAADKNLCYSCLADDHMSNGCPNKAHKCGICGYNHHFLMGWLIGGRTAPSVTGMAHVHAHLMNSTQEPECCAETRQALARMWDTELGQEVAKIWGKAPDTRISESEQAAEDIFTKTFTRREDGRCEVALLWRPHVYLPSNYQEALESFYTLERRMNKCPEMQAQFVSTIDEWKNKGIVSYLSPADSCIRYVLPTFMVVRLDKATTSYRLVVDGARKFHGTCINDKLWTGPPLINNLQDVLLRFRKGRHALTCDISMMYLNVGVPEVDREYLCIFYRAKPWHPLQVAQFHSHPFGLSSSPYVAMKSVLHHATGRALDYPRALAAVRDSVLVDDFVLSGHDQGELALTLHELQAMLGEIGMQLHKIAANHSDILHGIAPERVAQSKTIGEEETSKSKDQLTVKTLGLTWHAGDDTLSINFKPKHHGQPLTQRKAVSDGGRLYDPLGLVLPITMTNRILQQLCWMEGTGWDEPLPKAIHDKWQSWVNNTLGVHKIRIPWAVIDREGAVNKQRLMIFVDASGDAQAAVAYIQTLYSDTRLEGRLLTSRGRVTSLRKQESIPRLECLAASMGAELGTRLTHMLGWKAEDVTYFSDSTTTLWWIRTPKPLKVFVANRVCKILDASEVRQWKYVYTKENPADIPTRTASVQGLAKLQLWWWGPSFLSKPDSQWPPQPELIETSEGLNETKEVETILNKLHTHVQRNPVPDAKKQTFLREIWGRHSHSWKGLRVMALVWRAIELLEKARRKESLTPNPGGQIQQMRSEWEQQALMYCIRGEQQLMLDEVRDAVAKETALPVRYACWRLFLDDEQVLRINGRLAKSQILSYGARNPIFLTGNMPLVEEILRMIHTDLKHAGGAQVLLSQARQQYWIEHGLPLAKRVLKNCALCASRRARSIGHHTAPLHYTREEAPVGAVFHSVGIDMFCPMEVTQGRGKARGKRYGLIITCCFSRAISVEVMRDASADSCLLAFKRHAAIYGQPKEINSEQGTNLGYVKKVMNEIQTAWQDAQPMLQEHYPDIKWKVNPPYSPSYGGHYEALIKVLKTAFKHTAQWPKYLFNDEQLITGLKEAAAITNMRPLAEMSTDPNDPPPLRPSDFLHKPILGTTPDWRNATLYRRVKNELEAFQQELWERMRKEVLSGLQRVKSWDTRNPVEEGDLVLYRTDDWRPDAWPLARVLEVFPGKDGEKTSHATTVLPRAQPRGLEGSNPQFKERVPTQPP